MAINVTPIKNADALNLFFASLDELKNSTIPYAQSVLAASLSAENAVALYCRFKRYREQAAALLSGISSNQAAIFGTMTLGAQGVQYGNLTNGQRNALVTLVNAIAAVFA